MSAAIVFLADSGDNISPELNGENTLYVREHLFLGVTVDRAVVWSAHTNDLVTRLAKFTLVVRFISGTNWGTRVSSLIQIYEALIIFFLSYSLPIFKKRL